MFKSKPIEYKSDVKIEEKKPITLPERLTSLEEKLDTIAKLSRKKGKPFKLKWSVRTQMKNIAKRNKLLVWVLENNGNMHPVITKMKGGYIIVNGVPRKCTMDYRYLYNGKVPCIILPEWSVEPIGLKEYMEKHPSGMPTADAEKMIIGAVSSGEVKAGTGLSAKAWIFIGLAVIAGIYVLMGGAG